MALSKALLRFPRLPKIDLLRLSLYLRIPAAGAFFALALQGRDLVPIAPIAAMIATGASAAAAHRAYRAAADGSRRRHVAKWCLLDSVLMFVCAIPTPHSWSTVFSRVSVGILALTTVAAVVLRMSQERD